MSDREVLYRSWQALPEIRIPHPHSATVNGIVSGHELTFHKVTTRPAQLYTFRLGDFTPELQQLAADPTERLYLVAEGDILAS